MSDDAPPSTPDPRLGRAAKPKRDPPARPSRPARPVSPARPDRPVTPSLSTPAPPPPRPAEPPRARSFQDDATASIGPTGASSPRLDVAPTPPKAAAKPWTSELPRTLLPTCLVLAITLACGAAGWFALDRFSVLRDNALGVGLPAALAGLALVFGVVAVLLIARVREQARAASNDGGV